MGTAQSVLRCKIVVYGLYGTQFFYLSHSKKNSVLSIFTIFEETNATVSAGL
jgi:hypothetical protein